MSENIIERVENLEKKANITTGVEFETGRIIDGKKEYGKVIDCGAMPNNSSKIVETGLTKISFVDFYGIAGNNNSYPVYMEHGKTSDLSIVLSIQNYKIKIVTYIANYTVYTGLVYIYYTKI